MKFKESELAHRYLDDLASKGKGIEIGGSAHNPFGIQNVINVDYTNSLDTPYKQEEIKLCGEALPVDVVAFADNLPFEDNSFEFLINSHVFEHQCNSIKTLFEWHRVVRKDGIIFSIIPLRDALESDKVLPVTSLTHQLNDYIFKYDYENHELLPGHGKWGHYHVYTLESFIALIHAFNDGIAKEPFFQVIDIENPDKKVGNGFTVVMKVVK